MRLYESRKKVGVELISMEDGKASIAMSLPGIFARMLASLVQKRRIVVGVSLTRRGSHVSGKGFRVNQESEKLIPVKFRDADRRCYGWIDTNGNRVVGATFDNIGNYFHDGLIMAELDDRWGW